MQKYLIFILVIAGSYLIPSLALAQMPKEFHPGPVLPEYGQIATIDADMEIPDGTVFKVAFDVTKQAKSGEINRSLASAARFLNMHVEAGVAAKDIHLALVVHSRAVHDMTRASGITNKPLIDALLDKGVRIIVCGQSATAQGVKKADLLPGIEMALSAMTAHALLQQQDYTLNPF